MNKYFIFAVIALALSLTACVDKNEPSSGDNNNESNAEQDDNQGSSSIGGDDGICLYDAKPFTINSHGGKVYISRGNLQYQASTNTWRFAERQYYYVGNAVDGNVYEGDIKCSNTKISNNYSGWIDLFGWGTSGYNNKPPYMTSAAHGEYGNGDNDIAWSNYDWGYYNKISNGSNQEKIWRTLSKNEWEYLVLMRDNASDKQSFAKINDVFGHILLPDEWTLPIGLTFSTNIFDLPNEYTYKEWQQMEASGAVFLPASGYRDELFVGQTNECSYYWTSSYHRTGYLADIGQYAYSMNFHTSYAYTKYHARYMGASVRLVQDVK